MQHAAPNRLKSGLPAAARERLRTKVLARFGFEALVMDGARSRIRGADLPRDLFIERHAGNKMRPAVRRIKGRGLPRPGRHESRPNTGEPSAGDQSVARGVGGIVAFHLANVLDAAVVAHQLRQTLDELRAIL